MQDQCIKFWSYKTIVYTFQSGIHFAYHTFSNLEYILYIHHFHIWKYQTHFVYSHIPYIFNISSVYIPQSGILLSMLSLIWNTFWICILYFWNYFVCIHPPIWKTSCAFQNHNTFVYTPDRIWNIFCVHMLLQDPTMTSFPLSEIHFVYTFPDWNTFLCTLPNLEYNFVYILQSVILFVDTFSNLEYSFVYISQIRNTSLYLTPQTGIHFVYIL